MPEQEDEETTEAKRAEAQRQLEELAQKITSAKADLAKAQQELTDAMAQVFPPIERFGTLQREIISLHRRIEGLNTTLGVLIGAGVAFGLYAMSQHANWRAYQGNSMWVVALGLLICMLGFINRGYKEEWLEIGAFFQALDLEPKALDQAIADGLSSYETGRNTERQKSNFQAFGASALVAGTITYVVIGYKGIEPILRILLVLGLLVVGLFTYGQLARLWSYLFKRDKIEGP